MFRSSSLVTSAFTMVPVAICSLRLIARSKTISAPVRDSDMEVQARTVWFTTDSKVSGAELPPRKNMNRPLPMRSSRRRSSGWKMMTSAIKPSSTVVLSREFIILNLKRSDSQSASRMMTMPRASRVVLVRRMSPIATYMSMATRMISMISEICAVVIYSMALETISLIFPIGLSSSFSWHAPWAKPGRGNLS